MRYPLRRSLDCERPGADAIATPEGQIVRRHAAENGGAVPRTGWSKWDGSPARVRRQTEIGTQRAKIELARVELAAHRPGGVSRIFVRHRVLPRPALCSDLRAYRRAQRRPELRDLLGAAG